MSELVDDIWLSRELGITMAEFQKRKLRIILALAEQEAFRQYRTDLVQFIQYRNMLKERYASRP